MNKEYTDEDVQLIIKEAKEQEREECLKIFFQEMEVFKESINLRIENLNKRFYLLAMGEK